VPAGLTSPAISRLERFAFVGSTNDVVRQWLADGTPEICVAAAEAQTEGRGRRGRRWVAPPGAALLLSVGFRPSWLPIDRGWRLPATVSLAMADAAEDAAGLPTGSIGLKWPNDLVVEVAGPKALLAGETSAAAVAELLDAPVAIRKLAGVLGESDGLGTADPRVVVGIGINTDWPRGDFPAELESSMTSLAAASGGRPIDNEALLAAFVDRLEGRIEALRAGFFDLADWVSRQATTGRDVHVELDDRLAPEGRSLVARAVGVDAATGGLVVVAPGSATERTIHAGEVVHIRLADAPDPASL